MLACFFFLLSFFHSLPPFFILAGLSGLVCPHVQASTRRGWITNQLYGIQNQKRIVMAKLVHRMEMELCKILIGSLVEIEELLKEAGR